MSGTSAPGTSNGRTALFLRMSREEAARIKRAAQQDHRSVASFVRHRVLTSLDAEQEGAKTAK